MSKTLEMAREIVKLLEEAEKANNIQLSELKPGEVFKIGKHDFIVLEQKNGATKVISKGFMEENIAFDEKTRDYSESNLISLYREESDNYGYINNGDVTEADNRIKQ